MKCRNCNNELERPFDPYNCQAYRPVPKQEDQYCDSICKKSARDRFDRETGKGSPWM